MSEYYYQNLKCYLFKFKLSYRPRGKFGIIIINLNIYIGDAPVVLILFLRVHV